MEFCDHKMILPDGSDLTMAKDIVRIEPNLRLSRVTVHNGIAYLSGLTADDPELGISGQTRQVLEKADRYLALPVRTGRGCYPPRSGCARSAISRP